MSHEPCEAVPVPAPGGAAPPPRDVRAPPLRAARAAGRASGGLRSPHCACARLPRLRMGRSGAVRAGAVPKKGTFWAWAAFPVGSCWRECGVAPPGEAGVGREGQRGTVGVWRRYHRHLPAEAPAYSPRGHRRREEPPTLLRRRKSLEPGRSGAGAPPSLPLRAVWGRKCRRRSPDRFSSTPLRMAPPSTGPALQSEWSRFGGGRGCPAPAVLHPWGDGRGRRSRRLPGDRPPPPSAGKTAERGGERAPALLGSLLLKPSRFPPARPHFQKNQSYRFRGGARPLRGGCWESPQRIKWVMSPAINKLLSDMKGK